VSVYGTGSCNLKLRGFSRKYVSPHYSLPRRFRILSYQGLCWRICLPAPQILQRRNPYLRSGYAPSSPHRNCSRCRNFNRLAISFAFRLHLRTRLTLIRLTLIRNPWTYGEAVFHRLYRYLCLHFLFWPLHHSSRYGFDAIRMLPYNSCLKGRVLSFGTILDARLFSALNHSTSELLRTL